MFRFLQQDVKNLIPPTFWQKAMKVLQIPRASQTAWDISYMFRQGGKTMLMHPKVWASTWAPMLKGMRNPEEAARIMDQIATRKYANVGHWSGLDFTEAGQGLYKGEGYFGDTIL